jgi:hypothetical protein
MAGQGSTSPQDHLSRHDLDTCIGLVKGVSSRARSKDLNANNHPHQKIRARVHDNGWHTWFYKDDGGNLVACCFFQLLRSRHAYSMCVGFNTTAFPMVTNQNCTDFLNAVVGGVTGDGLLYDCIKNILGVSFVYVILIGNLSSDPELNKLFTYMQDPQSPPHPMWSWGVAQNATIPRYGAVTLWPLQVP